MNIKRNTLFEPPFKKCTSLRIPIILLLTNVKIIIQLKNLCCVKHIYSSDSLMRPGQLFRVKTRPSDSYFPSRPSISMILSHIWGHFVFVIVLNLPSISLLLPENLGVQPACNQGQTNAAWTTLTELKWDRAIADLSKTNILNLYPKCLVFCFSVSYCIVWHVYSSSMLILLCKINVFTWVYLIIVTILLVYRETNKYLCVEMFNIIENFSTKLYDMLSERYISHVFHKYDCLKSLLVLKFSME